METKVLRKRRRWFVAILLLAGVPVLCRADNIIFNSSGTISGTETYYRVDVQNDGTNLQILGGTVNWLYARDSSSVDMYGGFINTGINLEGDSIFRLHDGTVNAGINVYSGATAYLQGGSILTTSALKVYDGAVANISGGNVSFQNFSIVGTLNVYGTDFNIETTHYWDGDRYNITGKLLDDHPFAFDNLGYIGNINLLPEPATLLLLSAGGLLLRKRR